MKPIKSISISLLVILALFLQLACATKREGSSSNLAPKIVNANIGGQPSLIIIYGVNLCLGGDPLPTVMISGTEAGRRHCNLQARSGSGGHGYRNR